MRKGEMNILLEILKKISIKLKNTPLGRSEVLGRLHGYFTVFLYDSDEIDYGKFKIKIDKRDQYIAKKIILYGSYEKKEIDLLCSLLKPGDTVLDIGANIGLYSLFLSQKVSKNGKVYSFEPDPQNAKLLRENIKINNCTNVEVNEIALSNENKVGMLFQVDNNRGNLSLADLNNTKKSVKVNIRRGEDFLKEFGLKPNAAKIDVEGAEPDVIIGLGDLIPNLLLFEFVPNQLKAMNHDPIALLYYLEKKGYSFDLVDAETGSLSRLSKEEIINKTVLDIDYNILARR